MESAIKNGDKYESIIFTSNVVQVDSKKTVYLYVRVMDAEFVNVCAIKSDAVITIDLPDGIERKLVSVAPFDYTFDGLITRYRSKTKIEDYLYAMDYGKIDYEYAKEYFITPNGGGCSAIKAGNFVGRNFDWLYNTQVQFIVNTPKTLNHNAVLGVAGIIPGITQSNVNNADIIIDDVDMFKLLPFYLLDGINDKGLMCTHNVVPLDSDIAPTSEVIALKEEKERIAVPMLVRYILDNFGSAKEAINYIKNYVTIYFTDEMLTTWKYQSHFMVCDNTDCFILEFINNTLQVIKHNYITNFQIYNVIFDEHNNIQYPPTQYGINKYGSGLERWDIIANSSIKSKQELRDLLNTLYFSNMYGDNFRYSELVKATDDFGDPITVDTDPAYCTDAKATAINNWNNRSRTNPKVWITCHSSIYDINAKTLYITNQESNTEYKFSLQQ